MGGINAEAAAETVIDEQRGWRAGRSANDDNVCGTHIAVRDALAMRSAQAMQDVAHDEVAEVSARSALVSSATNVIPERVAEWNAYGRQQKQRPWQWRRAGQHLRTRRLLK